MVRKPKGSHRAYKEWAPSDKLLQQNINRILTELYMHDLLEILPKFNSIPHPFPWNFRQCRDLFSPQLWRESKPSPPIHPLVFPDIFPWLARGGGGLPALWEADIVHFLLKYNSTEKFITGLSMHLLCKQFDRTHYDNFCYMFRCEGTFKILRLLES